MLDACNGSASRRDLIAAGFAPAEVDYWRRSGLMECTARGELRAPGSGVTRYQQLATMLWRAGKGARLGGPLLLAAHGIRGFGLEQHGTDHIIVPPRRRVRGVGFTVVRSPVPPEDEARIWGLPAVTVARGLVGASRTCRRARIEVAHDDAKFKGLIGDGELAACADRLGRAYGAPEARRHIATGRLRSESPKERDLFDIFRAGDPLPQRQVWVSSRGRWHRLDVAFPEARLALEYDGRHHDATREQDADRDLALLEMQIETVRVTNAMMQDPKDTRRRLLAVREQRLGLGLPPLVPDVPPWLISETSGRRPARGY